ncbi:hypothetical protein MRB53_040496 [Persea americana]|nr:hypothetical protein MRB53_040496 [Persea americana]
MRRLQSLSSASSQCIRGTCSDPPLSQAKTFSRISPGLLISLFCGVERDSQRRRTARTPDTRVAHGSHLLEPRFVLLITFNPKSHIQHRGGMENSAFGRLPAEIMEYLARLLGRSDLTAFRCDLRASRQPDFPYLLRHVASPQSGPV